ncbi:disintegrin and metalloproteinase domain-containing protein 8-like [Conger conger]|uniref:disintegrin and metalloproteinase domain-containing protein 8-like n=1 Tax=Conger conger TaxID=82655 RepID=UPI002A5AD3AD|nr:disintegrin and metalloproteinase domain-containing protein 8-like [Conger conger]
MKHTLHFAGAMLYISTITFLMCIFSWGSFVRSARELPDVTDYEIIRPQRLSRTKRGLSSEQAHPEVLQYALTIEGKRHKIHLEKNRHLIGKNYTETYYLEDGTEVTTSPDYVDHCYYHGHIQDVEDSSVSVGVCSGIRGFVRAEQQVYLIEPLSDSVDGDHAVYRQEHRRTQRSTCGNSNESFYDHEPRVSGVYKPNSPKNKFLFDGKERFVELYLVIDNAEYINLGRDERRITARALEVASHVDKLYQPLNIRVMLIGMDVWSSRDLTPISLDSDKTLNNFLQWRQDTLIKKVKHDNAQLITGVDFLGDTVGLAPTSAMCTGQSGAVNQGKGRDAVAVASTIAHEMGHNLGMSHDEQVCTCGLSSSTNCIMQSTIGSVYPEAFSSCSYQDLGTFLQNSDPRCLMDSPHTDRLLGGPVCGNAFLEAGEECDCGTQKECQNPCCNATTCRLTAGSHCAAGECCENCQLKQVGQLCRESANDCDLAEYCSGKSAQCPQDEFRMNGLSCGSGQGYCYNGQCPTYFQHCRRLWGSGAQVGRDLCFHENIYGSDHAYCKKTASGNVGCTRKNMKCGKIFCTGGKNFPITGRLVSYPRGPEVCKLAVDNSGIEDIGMVPTGTKCGDKRVCYDNACHDIKVYGGDDCSDKCSKHGVCNHERQCHCDPGWEPPYCAVKSDFDKGKNSVVIGVSVSVVILILLTLVVGGLMCCRKEKKEIFTGKTHVSHISGLSNPLFHSASATNSPRCGPPRVGQPTLVESSASPARCPTYVTVMPSRAPPQPPKKLASEGLQSNSAQFVKPSVPVPASSNKMAPSQGIPLPPTKPLPILHVNQVKKPNSHPPLPPMKPPGPKPSGNRHQVVAGGPQVPLKPLTKPR